MQVRGPPVEEWPLVVRTFSSLKRRPHLKTRKSLVKNKNMAMGPDGTRNQDLLYWRGPAGSWPADQVHKTVPDHSCEFAVVATPYLKFVAAVTSLLPCRVTSGVVRNLPSVTLLKPNTATEWLACDLDYCIGSRHGPAILSERSHGFPQPLQKMLR
jgi:hypothetical protein